MGSEMSSHGRELCYTKACRLLSGWLSKAKDPSESKGGIDDMGIYDYATETVQTTHRSVPLTYDRNFIPDRYIKEYGETEMRECFEEARGFLAYAAEHNDGIRGSY